MRNIMTIWSGYIADHWQMNKEEYKYGSAYLKGAIYHLRK